MKKTKSVSLALVALLFVSCKKEANPHVNETIRKYKLTYFYEWDNSYLPFKKNASLYINKQTDSCLLILRNKKGDTILSHLDKGIFNTMMLEYKANRGNWLVTKKDFGKTSYDDSLGAINNPNRDRFPLYEYFTIDKENRKLKKIKLIDNKEFIETIAIKYKHLKSSSIAALENNSAYVFKDTTNNQQVLYQLETKYILRYINGKYVLEPEFKSYNKIGIYKNGVICRKGGNYFSFGEKVFYGKDPWQFNFRYEIYDRKYFRFRSHIKRYGNLPGDDLFKTEFIVYDNKNKSTKIIKDFPKDSLFEDYNINSQKQRNRKIYVGVDGPDHSIDFYYELDTIRWKLVKLPQLFNNLGYY